MEASQSLPGRDGGVVDAIRSRRMPHDGQGRQGAGDSGPIATAFGGSTRPPAARPLESSVRRLRSHASFSITDISLL